MNRRVDKVLFVVAEAVPFVKAGGVADVAGALPAVLKKNNCDVRIFLPLYGRIDKKKHDMKMVMSGLEERVGRLKYKFDIYEASSYEGVKVYLLANYKLYGSRKEVYGYEDDNLRFYFLNKMALRFVKEGEFKPQVIHCNDWQCGLIPYFLNFDDEFSIISDMATLYTVHNLSYQMMWVPKYLSKYGVDNGKSLIEPLLSKIRNLNFAKRAILNADKINAVSEQYAEEILTTEFGMGLDRILVSRKRDLEGILNGIDYFQFNPLSDSFLFQHYDENDLNGKTENKLFLQKRFGLPQNKDVPLFGIVSRLVGHKGFDLMGTVLKVLLKMPVQIVVTGTGEKKYVRLFQKLAKKYPKKIATHLELDLEVASQIYAGSDMFLMPSKFEPCGLSQLIALRYGSVPIVHHVGGLSDTICDFDVVTKIGNGFVFENYHELSFYGAIIRALEHYKNKDVWIPLVKNVMRERFSWDASALKYLSLYEKAYQKRLEEY